MRRVIRPKALTHRGVVEAAAFFVDTSLNSPIEARRRALALWVPGAAVYREPGGWLIRLPAPRRGGAPRPPRPPPTPGKNPPRRGPPRAPAPRRVRPRRSGLLARHGAVCRGAYRLPRRAARRAARPSAGTGRVRSPHPPQRRAAGRARAGRDVGRPTLARDRTGADRRSLAAAVPAHTP